MKDLKPQGRLTPEAQFDHEESTINLRTIAISAVCIIAFVVSTQLVIGVAMRWISIEQAVVDERHPDRHAIEVEQFPTPRLQAMPHEQLATLRRQELAQLKSFGWVDKSAGIAHIPIDRALEILTTKGLPKIPAPELKPGEAAPVGVSPLPTLSDGATTPSQPQPQGKMESPR